MENNIVKVVLWGKTVGYLQWRSENWKTEGSVFQFDKSFLESGLDISPLKLSINDGLIHVVPRLLGGYKKDRFKGLPSVFADSLPDHWGTRLFQAWVKTQGVKMSRTNPVDMLSFIGTRGMGALEYYPAMIADENIPFDVDVEKLYAFAKSILEERSEPSFDADKELLWEDLIKLGTSPGGKRPKALIAVNKESNIIKSGQVSELPEGFEHYILKYDNEKDLFPYARVEYVYYLMCRNCGINIQESELRRFDNSTHFITKRFDRVGSEKIHMQSLRAMVGGADSYEEAYNVLNKLDCDYIEREQLFRIMAFNVIAGNIDDHDGNLSFLMDKTGKWRLAPAYDIVYSIDSNTIYSQKGQFMSVNGKNQEITYEDIIHVGRVYGIKNPSSIIESILDEVSRIDERLQVFDVVPQIRMMITTELNMKYSELVNKKTSVLVCGLRNGSKSGAKERYDSFVEAEKLASQKKVAKKKE